MTPIAKKIIIATLLILATQSHAYNYDFFNHTEKDIALAIRLREENGPLYTRLVKAKSQETFEPGRRDFPMIKSTFCLEKIYYVKSPTTAQKKNNYERAPWKEIPIHWVDMK